MTFNSSNTFTSIERIVSGGFTIDVDTGATIDLTGITFNGASVIEGQIAGAEDITGSNAGDTIRGFGGADTLRGGIGNDFIYGGDGDDIIYGGDDRDDLYGEAGADTFIFENAFAFNDLERVRDFSTTDNDAIDISDLLSSYDPLVDDITTFVQITDNGTNSTLYVDVNGTSTFDGTTDVATLYGITGITDEALLETNGHLITS